MQTEFETEDQNDSVLSTRESTDLERGLVNMIPRTKFKPFPKKDEVVELYKRIQEGDLKAREEMITRNLPLVQKMVMSELRGRPISEVKQQDLLRDYFQEGYFGLATAVDRFQPDLGFAFSTYATHWIKQAISRARMNLYTGNVRKPVHIQAMTTRLSLAMSIARAKSQSNEKDWDLITQIYLERYELPFHGQKAEELNKEDPEAVALTKQLLKEFFLDGHMTSKEVSGSNAVNDDNDLSLLDSLEADTVSPEQLQEYESEKMELVLMASRLTEKERLIIRERFVCERTLEEVGQKLNLTRERIRQIESKALRKMRAMVPSLAHIKEVQGEILNPELFLGANVESKDAVKLFHIRQKPLPVVQDKVETRALVKQNTNGPEEPKSAVNIESVEEIIKEAFDLPPGARSVKIENEEARAKMREEIEKVCEFNYPKDKALATKNAQILCAILIDGLPSLRAAKQFEKDQASVSRLLHRWRLYRGVVAHERRGATPFKSPDGTCKVVKSFNFESRPKLLSCYSDETIADALEFAKNNQHLVEEYLNLPKTNKRKGQVDFPKRAQLIVDWAKNGMSIARIVALTGISVSAVYRKIVKYNDMVSEGLIKGERVIVKRSPRKL